MVFFTAPRSALFTALFLFLSSSIGLAQTTTKPSEEPEGAKEETTHIEEMVVTARKREEKAQETPVTITAFSETQIKDIGIEHMTDVLSLVPNITFLDTQNPGTITMTVRAVTQVRQGEAPVTLVVDGVNQVSPNVFTQDLFDIERIEVLKGPQGALYGRNAIGGAISIITRRPTAEPEHFVRLGFGKKNLKKWTVGSSGPIVDGRLFYRIAGSFLDRNGYFQNSFLGTDVDPQQDRTVNFRLSFFPTDKLEIDFKASGSKTEAGAEYYVPLEDGMSNGSVQVPDTDILGDSNREIREYSLKFDYRTDAGTFTAISAFNEVDEVFSGDLDFSRTSFLGVTQALDVEAYSQEIRFTSRADRRFRWIVGAYLLETDRGLKSQVDIDFDDNQVFDAAIPFDEINNNQATAYFAQADFDINERMEISAAYRFDQDDREQTDLVSGNIRSETFDAPQAKLTLSIDWKPEFMTYGTFSQGFRSGGFNPPGNASFTGLYQDETTNNLEAGFKSVWWENRLVLNGALFRTQYDDQQFFIVDLETGSQGILNIEESIANGLELDAHVRPFKGFDIFASVGLIDTEIEKLADDNPFLNSLEGNFIGNKTPGSTEDSYHLAARYRRWFKAGFNWWGRIDYERLGELYWHLDNADIREPVSLINLRAGLEHKTWSITWYVKNFTDETYNAEFFAREFSGGAMDIGYPSQPRTWGVEARKKF